MNSMDKDVLFQKIGNTWYIFCEQNGELMYTALPEYMDPYSIDFEIYEVLEAEFDKAASKPAKKSPETAA